MPEIYNLQEELGYILFPLISLLICFKLPDTL